MDAGIIEAMHKRINDTKLAIDKEKERHKARIKELKAELRACRGAVSSLTRNSKRVDPAQATLDEINDSGKEENDGHA